MKYIVADIYPGFACKCGECRHNCCVGWPVAISKEEHDRLLAAPCREEYRAEIKAALRMNFAPDEERYAHIVHDQHARCRLLRPDGLCGLQKELGEGVLPAVCRLYPRNRRRSAGVNECALSLSCEAVTEAVLASRAPLGFTEAEIREAPEFEIGMSEVWAAECRRAVELMEDRSMTLPARFTRLGEELFGCRETCDEAEGRLDAVRLLQQLTEECSGKNKVAGPLCTEALQFYGMSGKEKLSKPEAEALLARYAEASEHALGSRPGWPEAAERLLITHMFYNSFPHVGGTNDGDRAFYGLVATFAFVKFVFVGSLRRWDSDAEIADVLADVFRMVEHSDFKYRAARAYRKQAEFSPGCWRQLASL